MRFFYSGSERAWLLRGLNALILCFLIALVATQTRAQSSLDRIERARLQQMLKTIKEEIKNNYYDPNFHGMDLDANFAAAEEKLKNADSLGQGLGIIAQTLINFEDSHLFFIPPPRPGYVEYGWEMQMVGEQCLVTAVQPKSDAEKQGLKPGDLVLSLENFKPTRKEFWKMQYYYNALSPRRGLHVIVQSPGQKPRELDLAARVVEGNRLWNYDFVRYKDRPATHRFYKANGVAVWKMEAFDLDEAGIDSAMERVGNSKALILDMRDNGGGYEIALLRLLGYFFDHDVKVGDIKRRKEEKSVIAKAHKGSTFQGKVIVLVDSGSGSAAELFARVIQLEKRGVIIGDRSSGAVMRSKQVIKQTGSGNLVFFGVSVTDADILMSDGKSLEHVGVTPDELLLPTGENLAAGQDIVLARAVQLAGMNLSPTEAGRLFPYQWPK